MLNAFMLVLAITEYAIPTGLALTDLIVATGFSLFRLNPH